MTEPNGKRMWRRSPLKSSYEVAIVGAGIHGLATAYYLAKNHGITDVAVLDKGYLGGGASGRNTAIVRSNYRTAEGVPFYQESVKLYEQLAGDLDFNVMFSQHGHLTLAHTDRGINSLRERAEMNQILGVNSRVIFPEEIQRLVPAMALKTNPHYPVMAALYHPPGGIIRHDAVVWGYARGCDRRGVQIHPFTTVTAHQHPWRRRAVGVDQPRRDHGQMGRQLHGRSRLDHLTDGRGRHADHHASAAGVRQRTAQAVSRSRHRQRHAAHLREPDRSRRAGDRAGNRSVYLVLVPFHAPVPRRRGRARPRPLPVRCQKCDSCGSGPGSAT